MPAPATSAALNLGTLRSEASLPLQASTVFKGKTPWVATWLLSIGAILAIDFCSLNIDLTPLIIVPLLAIADLVKLRFAIALSIALATAGVLVEAIGDHRGETALQVGVNVVFLAVGYIVAVLLFTCLRSLIGESRSLYEAVDTLRSAVPRLFPQVGTEMLGWRISIVDARRPEGCHEFHHIVGDADGCELLVGDVLAKGLNDVMVLSMIRGAIAPRSEVDPAVRLRQLNNRLLDVGDSFTSCAACCAFLDPDGVIRLAAGGYGPVVVQRHNGALDTIEGGGRALGTTADLEVCERLLFLERGERLLLAGDGLMSQVRAGAISLRDVIAHPDASAARLRAVAPETDAFGVIVERSDTGPFEHLTRRVLSESRKT